MSTHSFLKKYGRLDLENKPTERRKFIEDQLAKAEAKDAARRRRYEIPAHDGLNESAAISPPATRDDYEAMAYRNGWTVSFNGELLNPNRDKRPGFQTSIHATSSAKRSPTVPPK